MEGAQTIKRLLVANRGEIAIRIISSARELGIYTIAVYTADDPNHAIHANESALLDGPSDFTNLNKLIQICHERKVDSVHPGYGFLSENEEFARALEAAKLLFVGPTAEILRQTGDKTTARILAESCGVPVLPAMVEPITSLDKAQVFVRKFGYPLMIKAVDGGGGRGIRLVSRSEDLEDKFNRASGESPSGKVFIEKAAIEGFRHVEIQILGDNNGNVAHLWERECSIQRRFQKVVELAPSTIRDRKLVDDVIQSAVSMASSIKYRSLGTFEFLVHESRPEFYFLEVNPRLQVEHTVTEQIADVDIVRLQLLLAQGVSIEQLKLPTRDLQEYNTPERFAIQLRVTAEDPSKGFTLSMGRITHFQAPGGRGVRVETHLSGIRSTLVGADYDSLLAKIIVTAPSLEEARLKGLRCLEDMAVKGVETNIHCLLGVLASPDFRQRKCSTVWLETNLPEVLTRGKEINSLCLGPKEALFPADPVNALSATTALGPSSLLFKKGDAFKVNFGDLAGSDSSSTDSHILILDRIRKNDFPNEMVGDVTLTSASSPDKPQKYSASISLSAGGSAIASSRHKKGDPTDPSHIIVPFPGTVVELLVDIGDEVEAGDVVMVVKQMKMELEIRASTSGNIDWICDFDDGETVQDGMLICVVKPSQKTSQAPTKLLLASSKL